MNRPIAFTLIVSDDLADGLSIRVAQSFSEQEGFVIRLVQTDPYWKNAKQSRTVWELSSAMAKTKAEWIKLFDQIVCHNSVFVDPDLLEIARYAAAGDSNDPFAVLYIPIEWVKKRMNKERVIL